MCVCVSVVSCRPTVKLLSSEDGKQRIVQAAQQLCRSVENKAMTSKDISVSMLDVILRGTKAHGCGECYVSHSLSSSWRLHACCSGVLVWRCWLLWWKMMTCLCSSRFQKNPRPRAGFEVRSCGQHAGLPALAHQTHRVHVSGHASNHLLLTHVHIAWTHMHSHRGTELDQTGALSLPVGTLASKCPAASPATRFGLVPFMGMLFFF